jgi:hypothetical protein
LSISFAIAALAILIWQFFATQRQTARLGEVASSQAKSAEKLGTLAQDQEQQTAQMKKAVSLQADSAKDLGKLADDQRQAVKELKLQVSRVEHPINFDALTIDFEVQIPLNSREFGPYRKRLASFLTRDDITSVPPIPPERTDRLARLVVGSEYSIRLYLVKPQQSEMEIARNAFNPADCAIFFPGFHGQFVAPKPPEPTPDPLVTKWSITGIASSFSTPESAIFWQSISILRNEVRLRPTGQISKIPDLLGAQAIVRISPDWTE